MARDGTGTRDEDVLWVAVVSEAETDDSLIHLFAALV